MRLNIHQHYHNNVFSITYFCIVYLTDAISKWSAIFKLLIYLLFAATATAVFGAFKVPLTNIYTLLSSHKLDFSIIVLN